MVSAWSVQNNLCFAQLTTDAMGCQKEIARQIISQGGDYILALKGNHGTIHEEVALFLDRAIGGQLSAMLHDFHGKPEKDHGRIETRRVWCTEKADRFEERDQWHGLKSFAAVERERTVGENTTCERR